MQTMWLSVFLTKIESASALEMFETDAKHGLTPAQLAQFQRDGYLVFESLLESIAEEWVNRFQDCVTVCQGEAGMWLANILGMSI